MSHHFNSQNPSHSHQGIELGAPGAYHQQGHFVPGYSVLHDEEPKTDSFYATSDTQNLNVPVNNAAVLQQGVIYQAVPQPAYGGMYNYPQAYPHSQIPSAYNPAVYQGAAPMYVNHHQMQFASPQNQAFIIETKIRTEFCCYTCMIYLGLIGSSFSVLGCAVAMGQPGVGFPLLLLSLVCLFTYILAIKAKSNLETKNQYYVFLSFCILTAVGVINNILSIPLTMKGIEEFFVNMSPSMSQDEYEVLKQVLETIQIVLIFFVIIIPLILNLLIIHYANTVHNLMKERDRLLSSVPMPVSMVA